LCKHMLGIHKPSVDFGSGFHGLCCRNFIKKLSIELKTVRTSFHRLKSMVWKQMRTFSSIKVGNKGNVPGKKEHP